MGSLLPVLCALLAASVLQAGASSDPELQTFFNDLLLTVAPDKDVYVADHDTGDKFGLKDLRDSTETARGLIQANIDLLATHAATLQSTTRDLTELELTVAAAAAVGKSNTDGLESLVGTVAGNAETSAKVRKTISETAQSALKNAATAQKAADTANTGIASLAEDVRKLQQASQATRLFLPVSDASIGSMCPTAGEIAYSKSSKTAYVCAGDKWNSLLPLVPLGTKDAPARTCKEVYESGVRKSGTYHLQYSTGDTFEQDCEMDIEGGGWTQIVDLCNACATGALHNAISCDAEKQTRGAWKFSRSAMQASGKQLLIKETGGRGRYSMYDFSRSSTCADNFVITVAGDYRPCNPFAYQWSNKQWVQQTGGTCNNNDHSQWNCEPEVGIRFHYGTRNCVNDGGHPPPFNGWGGFTGYVCGRWDQSNARFVKNWDGQCNRTPHKIFYR